MDAQQSEVARILQQITQEYEAAQRGLSGIAYGTAQHRFITARLERMGELHNELHTLIGDQAIVMVAETLQILGKEGK